VCLVPPSSQEGRIEFDVDWIYIVGFRIFSGWRVVEGGGGCAVGVEIEVLYCRCGVQG